MTAIPTTIPHGRTAQRLTWPHLPPAVRTLVEKRCGSPVVDAVSQGGGFTPGFASVLTCEDGTKHFVKAASVKAQRMFAESYREEFRKLSDLPGGVPAPKLLWVHESDWVVLGIEYVDARAPHRPWTAEDLDATLDALETVVERLTPAPEGMELDPFSDEFGEMVSHWDHVRTVSPDLPHLDEAAALAARFGEATAGDTLVHTDVRDDNVLVDRAGRAWICDWNWPVRGAAWLDTVFFLIGPRGDGLDADAVLGERALTRDVPAEHVDIVLALLAGYFFKQKDEPVPPASPYLRQHQAWQGQVAWAWLAERRGWS